MKEKGFEAPDVEWPKLLQKFQEAPPQCDEETIKPMSA
jgi:hypothetical protein